MYDPDEGLVGRLSSLMLHAHVLRLGPGWLTLECNRGGDYKKIMRMCLDCRAPKECMS